MTLREFLNLGLLRDNVIIKVFKEDSYGLGSYIDEHNFNRIYGIVDSALLAEKGLPVTYLDYILIEVRPSTYKNKTELVIKKS